MARGLNKVMLIGNLGADAETRYTPGGTAVSNLRLATTRSVKDGQSGEYRDETEWHDVVIWSGEKIAPYLTKGTQIFAEGRLQTRSWDDKDGNKRFRTEVVCNAGDVQLLYTAGGKPQTDGQTPRNPPARATQAQRPAPPPDDDPDSPF